MTGTSGGIAPLRMNDPEAIASELSEEELACIAGVDDVDTLLQLLAAPEQASPEQQTQLVGCLEDETLLRLFLTGLLGETGPLSVESSDCLRGGMEGIDLRAVLTAGDEQTAMIGSMSAMFVTISCLNDEDFEVLAPVLGMDPGEREAQMCVIETLGGPEGMATALQAEDGSGIITLMTAALSCGLQMEGIAPGG